MAFVPGYENDIFISYAHIDNEPVITGKPGWVDFFQDILRKRIRVRLGAEIEVFRDPQLRRYGKFSDELQREVSASAAFICVLSPRYVQSDWCLHELSQFCRLAGSSRVIKVVKTAFDEPRDDQQLRPLFEEIGGILDSRFYREDARTGLFKDLQPEIIADDIPAFIDLIDVVAQNLVGLLKQLREPQAGPAPSPPPTAGEGGGVVRAGPVDDGDRVTVYLAETTRDLAAVRDEIRTELTQYDCRVLPDQPLPQDADELTARVRACLEQAALSVHLLGANYGTVPELEERSVPHIQYDLARESGRPPQSTHLVWMPDGIAPSDARQQRLVDDVRNSSTEFLRTKIEDLKFEIHKKLAPAAKNVWEDEDSVNVSLFCHARDMESVAPLYSYLTVAEFFKVKFPLKDAQSFQSHQQLLQSSDAVIVYYGAADEDWFVNIWRLIQRQMTVGRERPVLAKAIYAGQPPTVEKRLLESDDPLVIKNFGQFTPNVIAPFVEKIKAAKGGGKW